MRDPLSAPSTTKPPKLVRWVGKLGRPWNRYRCRCHQVPRLSLGHEERRPDFEAQRMCSSTSVQRLNQASNRLLRCFKAACTPLAVLLLMQVILEPRLSASQNVLPWSETTSTFLLQITATYFGRLYPVFLLIHLLTFGSRNSE